MRSLPDPARSTSSASSSWWRRDSGSPPTARSSGVRRPERGRPPAPRRAAGRVYLCGFFNAEPAHLEELTLVAIESRAGADLGLGRHDEIAGELEALCREHPLRERLWELLILALYRSGRQAEALRAYAEIRDRLVGELGIDPGPTLRQEGTPGLHPGPGPVARPSQRPRPRRPRLRLRWSPAEGSGPTRRFSGAGPLLETKAVSRGRGVVWCRVRG